MKNNVQTVFRSTPSFKRTLVKGAAILGLTETEVIQRGVLMYLNEMVVQPKRTPVLEELEVTTKEIDGVRYSGDSI